MTALALAGRLVTTAGILDGGVLEVRLDGTIGYVGPASGWPGPGAAGRPTVRMVTLAPELPGAAAAAELLERSGILVGLGHTGADARGFGDALRSLRRPLITHLFNGMEPLHHRRPGPVAASL